MIIQLNRVTCRPGREEELERRLHIVAALSRADPDCEVCRWLRSDADGEATIYFNLS